MPDFFALLISVVLVASPAYVIGWYTGARTFRNRQQKVAKALEDYQKAVVQWTNEQGDDGYWRGYGNGVEATLKALYSFLATFKGDTDGTP